MSTIPPANRDQYVVSLGLSWWLFGSLGDKIPPDLRWWLERPIAIIGPLICTLPVIYLFGCRRTPVEQTRDKSSTPR